MSRNAPPARRLAAVDRAVRAQAAELVEHALVVVDLDVAALVGRLAQGDGELRALEGQAVGLHVDELGARVVAVLGAHARGDLLGAGNAAGARLPARPRGAVLLAAGRAEDQQREAGDGGEATASRAPVRNWKRGACSECDLRRPRGADAARRLALGEQVAPVVVLDGARVDDLGVGGHQRPRADGSSASGSCRGRVPAGSAGRSSGTSSPLIPAATPRRRGCRSPAPRGRPRRAAGPRRRRRAPSWRP